MSYIKGGNIILEKLRLSKIMESNLNIITMLKFGCNVDHSHNYRSMKLEKIIQWMQILGQKLNYLSGHTRLRSISIKVIKETIIYPQRGVHTD